MKIYRHGVIPDEAPDDFIQRITLGVQQVVVPSNDNVNITDYWLLFVGRVHTAYFGTPESFAEWQREHLQ